MFYTKKIKNLKSLIESLDSRMLGFANDIYGRLNKLEKNTIIPCEICKCRIAKEDAIKGKSVVVDRTTSDSIIFDVIRNRGPQANEAIHTPYYCLRCKKK